MPVRNRKRQRVQARPERTTEIPRAGLVSLWDWRRANAHLFASDDALRWHLRTHREAYVAGGAVFEINKRIFCEPQRLETVLREVGAQTAHARCAPVPIA